MSKQNSVLVKTRSVCKPDWPWHECNWWIHNLFPNLSEDTGRDVLRTALEEGINFWDTAYIYGP